MAANAAMTLTEKIIVIAVTILIITTVTVPIVDDVTKESYKVYNNEDFYYTNLVNGNHSITFGSSEITVDGVVIDGTLGSMPLIVTDAMYANPTSSSNMNVIYNDNGTVKFVSGITAATMTINASTKTISFSNITASSTIADFTSTYAEFCFVVGNEGDYVASFPSSSPASLYVDGTKNIFAIALSSWGTNYFAWAWGDKGGSLSGNTVKLVADLNEVADVEKIYTVDVTNSVSTSDVYLKDGSTNKELRVIIVPATVSGYTDQDLVNLLQLIPMLLILVPVMMAVRMITLKRN